MFLLSRASRPWLSASALAPSVYSLARYVSRANKLPEKNMARAKSRKVAVTRTIH
jgi:hypothetical protein